MKPEYPERKTFKLHTEKAVATVRNMLSSIHFFCKMVEQQSLEADYHQKRGKVTLDYQRNKNLPFPACHLGRGSEKLLFLSSLCEVTETLSADANDLMSQRHWTVGRYGAVVGPSFPCLSTLQVHQLPPNKDAHVRLKRVSNSLLQEWMLTMFLVLMFNAKTICWSYSFQWTITSRWNVVNNLS